MTVTKNMTHELDRDALKDAVGAYNAFECGSDVDHVRKIIAAYLSAAKSEPVAVKALEPDIRDILNAVAHVGVDFGFGPYELDDTIIAAARDRLASEPANG